jgi:hypothetical protein
MVTTALFGSGVSYISKIPGIGTITEKIISGEKIGRQADSIYYIDSGQPYLQHHVNECLTLIEHIKNDINSFYNLIEEEHTANYEDIYYILKQLNDSFTLEFENPGVHSLIEKLQAIDDFSGDKLKDIVSETIKYIECVVWQMISYRKFTFEQFEIVPTLIKELHLQNIISLNHDLVLDTYLQSKDIEYYDGFEYTHYKYPQWVGFENTSNDKLNLFKLHGSVDWFEVGVLKPQRENDIFKLPNDIYIQAVHHEEDKFWGTTDGTPKLLIGTFNKMLGYLSGIFEILYDAFKMKIKSSNLLIISGYGFGDKGINTQLSYWLNHESSIKMIIIHPDKEALIRKSRGNFRLNLMNANWKHPKVEFIEKKFEEVGINEITEAIERRRQS